MNRLFLLFLTPSLMLSLWRSNCLSLSICKLFLPFLSSHSLSPIRLVGCFCLSAVCLFFMYCRMASACGLFLSLVWSTHASLSFLPSFAPSSNYLSIIHSFISSPFLFIQKPALFFTKQHKKQLEFSHSLPSLPAMPTASGCC